MFTKVEPTIFLSIFLRWAGRIAKLDPNQGTSYTAKPGTVGGTSLGGTVALRNHINILQMVKGAELTDHERLCWEKCAIEFEEE